MIENNMLLVLTHDNKIKTSQTQYLIKNNVTKENFFDETLAEISARLTNQNITENLSIMFISSIKKNQEIDNKIFKLPENN